MVKTGSPILEVSELVKEYPSVRAVDHISFTIKKGSCFGLLGPNGAGKSTIVEMMEGVIKPTSGSILYKGQPLNRRYKAEVGIQFQSTVLQDYLTTKEVLQLFQSFYPKTIPLPELIDMCSLGDFLNRDNRKLSGGQRQRLYLALALLNDPEVLYLDEPTTGLDPQSRKNFWDLIQSIKRQEKTIVLTTHYMEEAQTLCDEIVIIDNGRILSQGTPRGLLNSYFSMTHLILPREAIPDTVELPWQTIKSEEAVEIMTEETNETIQYLMNHNIPLTGMQVKSPTLEDLFLELTGKELRG